MSFQINAKSFREFIDLYTPILLSDNNLISLLSNTSAALNQFLTQINWVGFYLYHEDDDTLYLGPFQGKVACTRIKNGLGVCGTATKTKTTQLVKNVHEFPDHIACDSASNSEIVIPLFRKGKLVGVLDIDSPEFSRFSEEDQANLEEFCKVLETVFENISDSQFLFSNK